MNGDGGGIRGAVSIPHIMNGSSCVAAYLFQIFVKWNFNHTNMVFMSWAPAKVLERHAYFIISIFVWFGNI